MATEATEIKQEGISMDDQEVDITIHTNKFSLNMTGLSNLKFDIESHFITSGQPWEGISKIECNDEGCTMYVEAGRKGSSQTADWFKGAIKPGSAIACDSFDSLPGDLNFAFKGKMSFDHGGETYTGKDIVIAQGRNARSRNNWWMGGPHFSEFVTVQGFFATAGQTFQTSRFLPAKVAFSTSIGHVSSMQVGVIGLNQQTE